MQYYEVKYRRRKKFWVDFFRFLENNIERTPEEIDAFGNALVDFYEGTE